MTAGGDEEKVKKGKTTLINALIGLFVIFIAWQIVGWIFGAVSTVTVANIFLIMSDMIIKKEKKSIYIYSILFFSIFYLMCILPFE